MSRVFVLLLVLILPLHAFSEGHRHLTHSDHMLEHMLEHARHIPHSHDENGDVHHHHDDDPDAHSHHHEDDPDRRHDDHLASSAHLLDFDYGTSVQAVLSQIEQLTTLSHTEPEPPFLARTLPNPIGSPPLRPPRGGLA